MKKSEFKKLLADGYGSALLYLKSCKNPADYSRQTEYCCTHDTCFDMQCEGDRAVYLYDAIKIMGEEEHFKNVITDHMKKTGFSHAWWESMQELSLLVCFYNDGYTDVLDFMKELYEEIFKKLATGGKYTKNHCRDDGFEHLCITIAQINPSFYLKVIHDVGEYLVKYPESDMFSLDWFYYKFKNDLEKKERETLLEKIPSEYINAFSENFDYDFPRIKRKKDETNVPATCEELWEYINKESNIWNKERIARLFGMKADKEELIRLAKIIASEKDEEKKRLFLPAFKKTEFPLEPDIIYNMLGGASDGLKEELFYVMCKMSDERVKYYAKAEIDKLPENLENPYCEFLTAAFCAFLSKPEEGDFKYIFDKISFLEDRKMLDDFDRHALYGDIQTAIEKNPSRKAKDVLNFIYPRMKCAICRLNVIKTMSKCRCLSDEILKEASLDGYLETRKYAEKLLKRRKISV